MEFYSIYMHPYIHFKDTLKVGDKVFLDGSPEMVIIAEVHNDRFSFRTASGRIGWMFWESKGTMEFYSY